MTNPIDPFKIELLIPTPQDLMGVKKVTVMDIMEGLTKNFHPNGLFSVEIFGKVGEARRMNTFAYGDLNIDVFHPLVFKVICDLKALYEDIMQGRAYAVFDETIKDFVKSNAVEGRTGFAFFVEHFSKIKFEQRASPARTEYIKFIEMYRTDPFVRQVIFQPAGLRDYMVDDTGKPSEDEINLMYRSLMSIAGSLENVNVKSSPEFVDATRYNMQIKCFELYKHIISMVLGKHMMLQDKGISRRVVNTTRNVITSNIPDIMEMGDERSVPFNATVIGLYQHMRDIMPLVVYHVHTKYSQRVFGGINSPAYVTDKKTLHKKMVTVSPKLFDQWMTYEGIERVADTFQVEAMRHYPVRVGEDYFGLIYKGPDNTFKFIQDIDELPEGRDPKDVSPITMTELLYAAIYREECFGFTTRYPIEKYGSTFPGTVYLKTTTRSEIRTELDVNWQPMEGKALQFPIRGLSFFNSMSIPIIHVPRAGADFDGDQMTHMTVMLEESKAELKNKLNDPQYYKTLDGKMAFTFNDDYISLALKYLTER